MAKAAPRRRPPDVRREQLLDAAQRVLLERGLRATTVADVAEAAGVAKGTMYLYYESKDDLLAALRSRYLDQYAAALRPSPGRPVSERIRQMIIGLFDFAVDHHELHHLLFHEAGFSEEDAFTSVRNELTDLIEEGVESGELRTQDVQTAAAFVLHGVHGALVHGLHSRRPSRRRTAKDVADLVDRALRQD
jgi:AcrR family transcriptional regulator